MATAKIGVIGGSGLYAMDGLANVEEVRVETPFGAPSDAITTGTLESTPVAFLPRHGRGHRYSPSQVPSRANIWALKQLGVEWIISVSAVGSMREAVAPLDVLIPDQLFDRTRHRPDTLFGQGIVVHCAFAEPFCATLRGTLMRAASAIPDLTVHDGGTYICIEGPEFSTRAESRIYRQWGVDVIGMTALPEARLAREAEMHYATLACVTDYDCWHESAASVTVDVVVANLNRNVANARHTIRAAVRQLAALTAPPACGCDQALANAIMTAPQAIPDDIRRKYGLLLDRYLS